jgi:hypothetical protein
VRRSTRPSIILGTPHKSRFHGISFHVTHGIPQMRLVKNTGFETALPEMAVLGIPRVEVTRVFTMNPLERDAECTLSIRDHDMVDVVAHKAVGPNSHFQLLAMLDQELDVNVPIHVVMEDRKLPVAALGKVVGKAGKKIAKSSSHDPSVTRERT